MTRLDGLGILVNGYSRNVRIQFNEFSHLGGSAVALWGRYVRRSMMKINDEDQ
jgi:hypothetical protein